MSRYRGRNYRTLTQRQRDRKPLKIKGYLPDLEGKALMMTVRGHFLYLMYVDEYWYARPMAAQHKNKSWLSVWMTPMNGAALKQYKEVIKYTKQYTIPHRRRGRLYDRKITQIVKNLMAEILDPQQAGPTWMPIFTDNKEMRQWYSSNFKYGWGSQAGHKIPTKMRWKSTDRSDADTYSPIFAKYAETFKSIISRFGADESRVVNFINYYFLPPDFWLQFYHQTKHTLK